MGRGVRKAVFSDLTVTAVSYVGLVVTLTAAAHGLLAGEIVTIGGVNTGATVTNVDGTWALTSVTVDTMTFAVASQPTGTTPQTGLTITHAVNSSASGVVDVRSGVVCGIEIPAAWTTADIELLGSPDGVTFSLVQESYTSAATAMANYHVKTPAVSTLIPLDTFAFSGVAWLRVRSVNAGLSTALNQAAPRTLRIITNDD